MKVDLVADVGNSQIKWGACHKHSVTASAMLPPDDEEAWQAQLDLWARTPSLAGAWQSGNPDPDIQAPDRATKPAPLHWAVTGVHPDRRERLVRWVRQRQDQVQVLDSARLLPLRVLIEHPDQVGIDRLLDAVAVNARRRPFVPAVVVDAGSAVTVDWLNENGDFCGGAILPGLRLMAHALHDYTALLPVVEVPKRPPDVLGTRTVGAIEAGIFWAVVGGVQALVTRLVEGASAAPEIFLTGGDAPVLAAALRQGLPGSLITLWSEMTLEGIRLSAEALP